MQSQVSPTAGGCSPAWDALIRDAERMAAITPGELMPIFQGMMREGCRACPREQTRVCQFIEKPMNVIGHDIVRPLFGMPWEFKAEDLIAGGASDGTVRREALAAVIAAVEETARENGHEAVTLVDYSETIGRLARTAGYIPPGEADPEFTAAVAAAGDPLEVIARGKADSRRRAEAFRANPAASTRNAVTIRDALPYEAPVHDLLASRELHWCSHLPHLFSRMMLRLGYTEEDLLPMVEAAEAVARERNHPGVTPRDAETALARAAAAALAAQGGCDDGAC